jgi:hypothetical protein
MSPAYDRRRTPKPNAWILDPSERQSFGKVRHLAWKADDGREDAVMIRAAQMQHVLACQVRRHAAERRAAGEAGWSLPSLAERLESLSYDGLTRVLRGDVHMTLLHAVDLSRVLRRNLLLVGAETTRQS